MCLGATCAFPSRKHRLHVGVSAGGGRGVFGTWRRTFCLPLRGGLIYLSGGGGGGIFLAVLDREACLKLSGVYAKQPLSGSWTAGLKFQSVCIGLSCYGIRGCHDGFWMHCRGSD